jgi:hypothetical protein
METTDSLFEPLLERAEAYSKTSFNLFKLKSIDKTSDVLSSFISRLLLALFITIFLLTLNIAFAFWIGDILGKIYYGFFIVAGFYGILGIILYIFHPSVKARVNESIVKQMLN